MTKSYTVHWQIKVKADSPIKAAVKARQHQEPETDAVLFTVVDDEDNRSTEVNLNLQEPLDNIKRCPNCAQEDLNAILQVDTNHEDVGINLEMDSIVCKGNYTYEDGEVLQQTITGVYCVNCEHEWKTMESFKRAVLKAQRGVVDDTKKTKK